MPETRPGGVKAVHYSADDAAYTQIAGDVTTVDGLPPEAISQEHTAGDYQSGETSSATINFNDHTDYDTLRGLAVGAGREKQYVAFEFYDGTILKTSVPVYIKCWLVPKGVRSDGDSEWALSWNHSADTMLEKVASL